MNASSHPRVNDMLQVTYERNEKTINNHLFFFFFWTVSIVSSGARMYKLIFNNI